MLMVAAFVASLLACGAPGSRGEPAPVLGPYAAARTAITPVVRPDPVTAQDVRGTPSVLRETRRMCDLHGGKGSC
jgi:hypothetical protein